MVLNFTAAHSSGISKSIRARRSHLSIASLGRRSANPSKNPRDTAAYGSDFQQRLDNIGVVLNLTSDESPQNVTQLMRHITESMFCELPQNAAGINSTRVAELLNYRKMLPPIVTLPHLHTLVDSGTNLEREIHRMIRGGLIRQLNAPGRGDIGEILVLYNDLKEMIRNMHALDEGVRARFITWLEKNPGISALPATALDQSDIDHLMKAGFLVSVFRHDAIRDSLGDAGSCFAKNATSLRNALQAPSGSLAAVGGEGIVHTAGGGGGGLANLHASSTTELCISMPNVGAYICLLERCRVQLVNILKKSRHREMPVDLAQERWNGAVVGQSVASKAKKLRGEHAGVLPGRTRKWKQFYGVSFNWVLEECVAAGLTEVFETGSVGRAIRVV